MKEPPQHDVDVEENIINSIQRSPHASTRRISSRLGISQSRVWRTLHENQMYPFHLQRVQSLQQGDLAIRLEYCNWLAINRRMRRYILFTDKPSLLVMV